MQFAKTTKKFKVSKLKSSAQNKDKDDDGNDNDNGTAGWSRLENILRQLT